MLASGAPELEFHPATPEEAGFHARVYTESAPDEPVTPRAVLEAWRQRPEAERFTIRAGGRPVGLAGIAPEDWTRSELRAARLEADLLRDARSHLTLGLAFDFVEERARAAGAGHFVTHARESDDFLILNLRRRGYEGKAVFEWWEIALQAVPGVEPELPPGFQLRRLDHAGLEPELDAEVRRPLSWAALRGELPAAMAVVSGGEEGANAWLGLAAPGGRLDARLARALEVRALNTAAEAGLDRLRTETAEAILKGRGAEGWFRVPGMIEFHVSVAERDGRLANPRI